MVGSILTEHPFEQLSKANKNDAFQKQERVTVAAYSTWHRFVDAVRALFGGKKAYQKAYVHSSATRRAIAGNNELASRVEFETLEAKLHSILDELLKIQEQSLSQKATALPGRLTDLLKRDGGVSRCSIEWHPAILYCASPPLPPLSRGIFGGIL